MNRIVFGALSAPLFLCSVGAAAAAPAPSYDWTGAYIGVHLGVDWSRGQTGPFSETLQDFSNAFITGRGIVVVPGQAVPFTKKTGSGSSVIGGGQAGYLFTSGNYVLGVEGDIDFGAKAANARESQAILPTAIQTAGTLTMERSVRASWGWSARARAGFAWDRYQLYATGGLAGADLRVSGRDTLALQGGGAALGPPQTFHDPITNITAGSASGHRLGWTLGGGGEWAWTDMISIGVEYRHTDLGRKTYNLTSNDVSVGLPVITAPSGSTTTGATPPKGILGSTPIDFSDDRISLRVNLKLK